MSNHDAFAQVLAEIREDQQKIIKELTDIRTELAISRNGFSSHEIHSFFQWINSEMKRREEFGKNVRRAVVSWGIPILCSAVIIGLITHFR
jgi:hypothetical protein